MKKIYSLLSLLLLVTFVKAQTIYTGKPIYKIDVKRAGTYVGSIKVELFPNIAYHHVRNFDSLVGVHFYDSTAFHRVIPGFVIQGGDPNSRHGATSTWGFGQPGQPTVNAEFSVAKHVRGILSAARSTNINSATSQFFICVAAAANLNGQYSVYGRVVSGINIVDTVVLAPRNGNDLPNLKHEMFITAQGSNDTVPNTPILNTPANGSTGIDEMAAILLKWNAVSDAIIYTVEVSDDPFYLNIVKTFDSPNTSAYLTNNIVNNTKYYWHVRANNGGHFSDWSTDWTFDTYKNLTGISEAPATKDLLVYPNPGNGKFTFTQLQKGDKVEVVDVLGNLVYQGISKENILSVDLEAKNKGIYFYRINSGKDKKQGKLIIK
jgi:peptidyl-prolyl cis-trans isomerase B (cyclophilin B)